MALSLGGCVSAPSVLDLDLAANNFASSPAKPGTSRMADAMTAAGEVPLADVTQAGGAVAESSPKADDLPEIKVAAFAPLPPMSSGASVDDLIRKYAAHYGLREEFVRKVVRRESTFNPRAFNRGHWGLMQIKHQTARGMGYRGAPEGLFDAETNLIYGVRYLRGAWLVAGGDEAYADRLYQSGYYYHAKRQGLLTATGLGRDRVRKRGRSG